MATAVRDMDVIEDSEEVVAPPSGKRLMMAMDASGDTRIEWDEDNQAEVDAARATFDKLIAKGYGAFKVNRLGNRGARIDAFDPSAEKIILVPQLAGG